MEESRRFSVRVFRRSFVCASACAVLLAGSAVLSAQQDSQRIRINAGHSQVLQYTNPVGRVSIADPKIADATVTTPNQILVNGKEAGSTSLVVWDEQERFTSYNVIVRGAASTEQVMLRVRFAEVKRTAIRELGTDFLLRNRGVGDDLLTLGGFAGKVSVPNDPLLLSDNVDLLLSVPTQNFSAVIRALEENRLLTTIAKPNLSAINGTEASFLAGGEFPVPIVQGAAGLQMVTIVFKEFGIRLKFTPTIMDSNLVNVKVSTEVSSLDFENGIELSGFRIPALMTRRAETSVELQTGQYLIIGGLVSRETVKNLGRVPLLGQVPILSYLLRSERFKDEETELVVMITPQIVGAMDLDATVP